MVAGDVVEEEAGDAAGPGAQGEAEAHPGGAEARPGGGAGVEGGEVEAAGEALPIGA